MNDYTYSQTVQLYVTAVETKAGWRGQVRCLDEILAEGDPMRDREDAIKDGLNTAKELFKRLLNLLV